MNRINLRMLSCALALTIASPMVFAGAQGLPQVAEQPAAQDPHLKLLQALDTAARRGHRAHHRLSRRAPHAKVRKDNHHDGIPLVHAPQYTASERKQFRVAAVSAQKAAAREAAERDARAENLYRSSQLSAPIIKDAKACKRIGTHGESIYENC